MSWGAAARRAGFGVLCLALACGKTENEPHSNFAGGTGAGGAAGGTSGAESLGGRAVGGRASGGATSGGAASGGSASGGEQSGGASAGMDQGGAGGDAGAASGGTSVGGDASGGTGGEVTTTYVGSISIMNAAERVPSKFTASASFVTIGTGTSCRRVTYGDCVVSDMCVSTANLPNYVSAGTIRVRVPKRNIEVVGEPSAAMGIMPLYAPMVSEGPFAGGDGLTVEASGSASVPGFNEQLGIPRSIRVLAPEPDAEGVIRAPRSRDITLDLQVTAQVVALEIRGAASSSGNQVLLSCSSKAWGAPAVIQAAALDALGYPQRLSVRSLHPASIVTGDWRVDMPVTFEVLDKNEAVIDSIVID